MSNLAKIFFCSLLIVFSTIFASEISCNFISYAKAGFKEKHREPGLPQDPITEWRLAPNAKYHSLGLPGDFTETNNYSFIKTPYRYKVNSPPPYAIILVTGNSTAAGWGSSNWENSFPSVLESSLSLHYNKQYDVHNLAVNSYNSWQEHAVTTRYLSSYHYKDDLLKPTLVISLSGSQDFWSYTDSFKMKENNCNSLCAGYLMYPQKIFDKDAQISTMLSGGFSGTVRIIIDSLTRFGKQSCTKRAIDSVLSIIGSAFRPKAPPSNLGSLEYRINPQKLAIECKSIDECLKLMEIAVQATVSNVFATKSMLEAKEIDYLFIHQPLLSTSVNEPENDNKQIGIKTPEPASNTDEGLSNIQMQRVYTKKLRDMLIATIPDNYIDMSQAHYPDGNKYYHDTSHYNDVGVRVLVDKLLKNKKLQSLTN